MKTVYLFRNCTKNYTKMQSLKKISSLFPVPCSVIISSFMHMPFSSKAHLDWHIAYTFVCQSIQQLVSFFTHKCAPHCTHLILDRRCPKCIDSPRGITPPGCNALAFLIHNAQSLLTSADGWCNPTFCSRASVAHISDGRPARFLHCENHQPTDRPIPHGNFDDSKSRQWSHCGDHCRMSRSHTHCGLTAPTSGR